MKTLITFILLAALTVNVFAQETISSDSYMQKAKNQKTAAWILLGTGLSFVTVSAIIETNNLSIDLNGMFDPDYRSSSSSSNGFADVLAVTGAGMMLGSIPLFIAHGKNKRKALLILKQENVMLTPKISSGKSMLQTGLIIDL